MLLLAAIALCALLALGGCTVAAPGSEPAAGNGGTSGTSQPQSELIVRFIDVGQGDCALISCDGRHMLIDGGPASASQKVYAILQNLGIDFLDAIIATHSDADHIGGISAALNYAGAGACFCPVAEADTRTFNSMVRYLDKANCPLIVPSPGDSFSLGAATVTFVGPTRDFAGSDNNTSLVCRIDHGSTSFLFTGDAERESEGAMIADGANLRADVLKVSHHGSASSTTDALLQAVQPSYAVISVGADNTYGHPADAVLQRLARAGVAVWRTDIEGSIIVTSNGRDLAFETATIIEK